MIKRYQLYCPDCKAVYNIASDKRPQQCMYGCKEVRVQRI